MFLNVDGNFKLSRYTRPNERPDPSLRQGKAYVVEDAPYKTWLDIASGHAHLTETPTCNKFQQQHLADVKPKAHKVVTGVGKAVCRHELTRAGSLVDFQRGER